MNPVLSFAEVFLSPLSGGSAPAFVAMIVIKATAVLIVGTAAAILARRAGAAVRHAIIALTLAAALALPLGMLATPAWRVGVLPAATSNVQPADPTPLTQVPRADRVTMSATRTEASSVDATASPPATTNTATKSDGREFFSSIGAMLQHAWIPLTWLLGFLSVLAWMVLGRTGLMRLARRAARLDTPEWQRLVDDERRLAGVDKPVSLLSSSRVSTPLAWGTRSPIILLPTACDDWPHEHRAVVLRHELAHIARGDALTQMVAGITCAFYWFHPLVWVAARKLRAEQERACDERVLSSGTPPAEYAVHLLEVARSARALGAHGLVSLAMARPSQLEGRLLAVLNPSKPHVRFSPAMRSVGALVALIAFVAVSAFTPMPRSSALPRAVTPTVIATQFVPPAGAVQAEKTGASKWSKDPVAKVAMDSSFERTVDVRRGGTLDIDLKTGAGLTIRGWDQDRVRVSGSLGGRDWRDTQVEFERTASGARLSARFASTSWSQSSSHRFEIQVPRRFNIRIRSAGGGISITDVEGEFTGNTGGGGIQIQRASGHAELSTGGGGIRVTDSNLSGSVSTGGGGVLIQRVRGGLRGSSGGGAVVYASAEGADIVSSEGKTRVSSDYGSVTVGSGGNVTINDRTGEVRDDNSGRIIYRKSGGSVNVGEAMHGADIRTGGGRVYVGRSAGDVSALTGGGDITIGPLDGSATATTGAGDVSIELTGDRAHSVSVASGNGRVTLVIPRSFSGRVELETAYTARHGRTRIESDWPLSITETDYWDDSHGTPRKFVRANQTIGSGSGGVLKVKTVNGNIVLRRGR